MVTASEMGRKGGKAKSEAKTAAVRKNASKPRGKWVSAIAYELANVGSPFSFGVVLVAGKGPKDPDAYHYWLSAAVRAHGTGLRDAKHLEFLELACTARLV